MTVEELQLKREKCWYGIHIGNYFVGIVRTTPWEVTDVETTADRETGDMEGGSGGT